jgi:hypothetical protein
MMVLHWISTLEGRPRQEVRRVWEEMGYTPSTAS